MTFETWFTISAWFFALACVIAIVSIVVDVVESARFHREARERELIRRRLH